MESVVAEPGRVVVRHRYSASAKRTAIAVELTWTLRGGGLHLEATAVPTWLDPRGYRNGKILGR